MENEQKEERFSSLQKFGYEQTEDNNSNFYLMSEHQWLELMLIPYCLSISSVVIL